jgi:hypothetical protein
MGGSAALQIVRDAGQIVRDAGLTGLVRRGSEHAPGEVGSERLLPVLPELRSLLPGGGLRRGATIGVTTHTVPDRQTREALPVPGATSLLLALLAEASRAGSWCAVVGLPTLGVAAAAELGVGLERLALVPHPGLDWPTVVAALLDGFDIVVVAAPGGISSSIASRLAARARQRGGVLMPYGPWPAVDLALEATDPVWHGVEAGRGRLRGRQLSVVARGRGAATASRLAHLWLPRPTGLLAEPERVTGRDVPAGAPAGGAAPAGDLAPAGGLATVHQLRGSWLADDAKSTG